MNIVLIGYRASGKTSVGRRLAVLLGYSFCDTDEIVAESTGKTIRQIVDEGGWPLFREIEKDAIAGISPSDRCVVAFGGGAVLDEGNVKRFSENSLFIWLKADVETVLHRMNEDIKSDEQRPPLSSGSPWLEVKATLRSREEVYRKHANFIVDTGNRSIQEVSEEIQRIVQSFHRLSILSGFFC
ncbi:MAG: shikimate kinase [Desulfobacteraceae bacterium]|nr:MAG: shikimate kinase [Desulfobacteraceae bacterium]